MPLKLPEMIRVCLLTFFLMTQLSTANSEGCDSFNNTTVDVNFKTWFYVVNGCLEPKKFNGKEIVSVNILSEVSRLGKNSIRNLPKLEQLDLSMSSLEILEPQAFRNLPSLKSIYMEDNNLKEIPKDVFNSVPTITDLYLSSNKINFIDRRAFSNMESLERIDLHDNALTYWNREWFHNCPNLSDINFYGNKISIIPRRAFASLQSLRSIDFGKNKITTIYLVFHIWSIAYTISQQKWDRNERYFLNL